MWKPIYLCMGSELLESDKLGRDRWPYFSPSLMQNVEYRIILILLLRSKKQPPEVLCKKRCSQKFRKIHRKTLKACNFIKKETLAQVFSCQFCEISKNIFFTEHLWATTSEEFTIPVEHPITPQKITWTVIRLFY